MRTKRFFIACGCMVILFALTLGNLPLTIGQEDGSVKSSIHKAGGVETVEFDTLVGTVEVNLPDDLSDTDTISGTVLVEPKGETKQEIAQNEDTLRGYVVEIEKTQEVLQPPAPPIASQPTPPQKTTPTCPPRKPPAKPPCPPKTQPPKPGSMTRNSGTYPPTIANAPPLINIVPGCTGDFTAAIPPKCGGIRVTIKNSGGTPICSLPVPSNPIPPKRPPGCTIPPSCTAGGPLRLPGPTDGCSWTTNVKVNGQTCSPIAESPRQTIAKVPENVKGPCTVAITECGWRRFGRTTVLPPKSGGQQEQTKPVQKVQYVFHRTGPFITKKSGRSADEEMTVSKNEITYTGIGVNTGGRKASCSFIFTDPPETLTVGDRFSFTGQISGEQDVSPLANFGCRSEGLWTKLLNPPHIQFTNSPTLTEGFPDYKPSGSQNYEVQDGKKIVDEYLRKNPDKANLANDAWKKFDMAISATGGGGGMHVEIKWTYILQERPQSTCGYNEARKRK